MSEGSDSTRCERSRSARSLERLHSTVRSDPPAGLVLHELSDQLQHTVSLPTRSPSGKDPSLERAPSTLATQRGLSLLHLATLQRSSTFQGLPQEASDAYSPAKAVSLLVMGQSDSAIETSTRQPSRCLVSADRSADLSADTEELGAVDGGAEGAPSAAAASITIPESSLDKLRSNLEEKAEQPERTQWLLAFRDPVAERTPRRRLPAHFLV